MRLTIKRTAGFIGPIFIGVLILVASLLALFALPAHEASADSPKTMVMVLKFGNNDIAVRSITFTDSITPYRALEQAGFTLTSANASWGFQVCGIDGTGQDVGPGGTSCVWAGKYWQTSYWDNNQWVGRLCLVDSCVITESGHIEGFNWGPDGNLPHGAGAAAGLRALQWLQLRQNATDGGYGDIGSTIETALPIAGNRWQADAWRRKSDAPSLMHYLYANSSSFVTNGGSAGKLAAGLSAGNGCWPVDAAPLTGYFNSGTGEFAPQAINHAWGMLGTKAMSQTIPVSATGALKGMITTSGGWGWPGFGDDTDTTAIAIEAMVAAGEPVTGSQIISGLTYIKNNRNSDGGFNPGWTSTTSSATTAAAVRAILAVGQNPAGGQWAISGTSPIDYLTGVQQPDGSYLYGSSPSELETRQVALALLGRWLPLGMNQVNVCRAVTGRVISGTVSTGGLEITSSTPVTDVTVSVTGWNGAGISVKNNAAGAYTVSVPAAGVYTVTMSKIGAVFSPTNRAVLVSGNPGDVIPAGNVQSAPGNLTYLPVVLQNQ